MNINDVATPEVIPKDIWDAIWDEQRKLHNQYKAIELKSGVGYSLVAGRAFNIDDIKWQYYFKDLAYRVIEELAEAEEAFCHGNQRHRLEEEIDALHFLVELNVVLGLPCTASTLLAPSRSYYEVIYYLGLAGNCLKQKPWKQTHHVTDRDRYYDLIQRATRNMIYVLRKHLTDEEIYCLYFKKNTVNQFRIRSKY